MTLHPTDALDILRGVVGSRSDRSITERILNVLRPYASNWNGTLGRGVAEVERSRRIARQILCGCAGLASVALEVQRHGGATVSDRERCGSSLARL